MLDIDYFKQYNDRHGHVIGDEVLRLLVKAIQAHVKKTDIVGRWGGEEFSIGLPGATTDQAYMVAKRVRETLAAVDLRDKNGQPIPNPTVSQGIATFPNHAQNTDQLVDVADIALYQAKHLGRDQVVIAE
jgi:diguanylate cyclase (GGDEF)-like protein